MSPIFPIDQSIKKVTGLLEREDDYIHAKYYSAVIMFEGGDIALMAQNNIVRLDQAPDDTVDLPIQAVDCTENLVGSLVTNAFVLHKPGETSSGARGPQLYLVLDRERMLGVVPTQKGSVLHIEPIMSSPLFRIESTLTTLENESTTMEEMIGY